MKFRFQMYVSIVKVTPPRTYGYVLAYFIYWGDYGIFQFVHVGSRSRSTVEKRRRQSKCRVQRYVYIRHIRIVTKDHVYVEYVRIPDRCFQQFVQSMYASVCIRASVCTRIQS